jgi:hypothetical protein
VKQGFYLLQGSGEHLFKKCVRADETGKFQRSQVILFFRMVLNVDDTNIGASAPVEGMHEGTANKPRTAGNDDHDISGKFLEYKIRILILLCFLVHDFPIKTGEKRFGLLSGMLEQFFEDFDTVFTCRMGGEIFHPFRSF